MFGLPLFKTNRSKTPLVMQMEVMECGAACLGMILAYYKKFISLEQLREDCGVSRDGVKAGNIVRAGAKYGLTGKGFRLDLEELKNVPTPAIIFWESNHFVVYEGYNKKYVFVNDPAKGTRRIPYDSFKKSFSKVVVTLTPNENFEPSGEKIKVLPMIKQRLHGHRRALAYLFLCGLGLSIVGIISPMLTRIFIDQVLVARFDNIFVPILSGLILIIILQLFFTLLNQYYSMRLRHKLTIFYTSDFFWHILKLPMPFFGQRWPADIASRVQLNASLSNTITSVYVGFFLNIIMFTCFLCLMLYFDLELTLIAIISTVINMILVASLTKLREDSSQQTSSANSYLSGAAYNGIQQIESLKAQGKEREVFMDIWGAMVNLSNISQKLADKSMFVNQLPSILSSLNGTVILCFGCYKVLIGDISIGTLFAFQFASSSFAGPLNSLLGIMTNLQSLTGSVVKLKDIQDHPIESRADIMQFVDKDLNEIKANKLNGKVEVKNITFGYSPLEPPLLKDFSFSVEPSEVIAIVGGSGSGKSTITKLIMNLYPIWSGEILFDGKNVFTENHIQFVNSVSKVDQEIMLFNGSFKENITLWDSTIELNDIIEACKDACVHDVITSHPGGYDSILAEQGKNLSGGQRQRVEIARALVKQPTVLILDEATSGLDTITEKKILNNIRRRGCTIIIIAHRLSTIRDADRILVLDKGNLVEEGTHKTLLREQSIYSRLIEAK